MNQIVEQNSHVHAEFMNSATRGQQRYQHQPWESFSAQLLNAEEAMELALSTNSSTTQYDARSFESTVMTPSPLNFMENCQPNAHRISDYEWMRLEEFVENLNREKNDSVVTLPGYSLSNCEETPTNNNAIKMWRVGFPSPTPSNDIASNFGTPFLDSDAAPDSTKPLKALSAYNFFFRYTRERLLSGNDNEDDIFSTNMQELLLNSHWYQDRSQKRRHRKSHGKIDFATLSRMVSHRWKNLPEDRKNFFKEIACKDMQRYRKEQNHNLLDF
jgi:HMG (high mobility group) box